MAAPPVEPAGFALAGGVAVPFFCCSVVCIGEDSDLIELAVGGSLAGWADRVAVAELLACKSRVHPSEQKCTRTLNRYKCLTTGTDAVHLCACGTAAGEKRVSLSRHPALPNLFALHGNQKHKQVHKFATKLKGRIDIPCLVLMGCSCLDYLLEPFARTRVPQRRILLQLQPIWRAPRYQD